MKFQELKKIFKNKFTMRVAAGVLCAALAGGSLGVYTAEKGGGRANAASSENKEDGRTEKTEKKNNKTNNKTNSKKTKDNEDKENFGDKLASMLNKSLKSKESLDAKEETVYLITDAKGSVSQTIVSSWLKNGSAAEEIKDVSNLSDIENVKGDETFTKSGDQITWQAQGADIYYKGTTARKAPIAQKLTYYLDGREISPEDLAGRSGHVAIRFDYTNSEKTTVEINGRKEEIYVPFTVMSGMILDDSFRNIRVNHGRVLSDGNKNIVIGFAMPGLKESLGVEEKDSDQSEFPEYIEVAADVEDFSLEMTATVAMTGLLSDETIAENLDLSELDDTMDDLTDAIGQLKDGSGELADGLDTLHQSMEEFADGAASLKDGVDAYTDGALRLADGIRTLSDSSGSLETGVNTLNSSAHTIRDGIQKLDQSLHAEMSEEEKAAAKQEAGDAITAQFQKGSDTYNMIYNAAVQNFNDTMSSEAARQAVQSGIQTGLQAQGLTSPEVIGALAEYYAANGFTDGNGQTYSAQICQSAVPGTETTYAVYFANAVLTGGLSSALAEGITSGIASQGADAVGESVVNACSSAARLAGETAVISGAEAAKKQIAAAIEAPDAASGYSLVTGSSALSDGTQQLADSVPALKSGISELLNGADELVGNNAALKDGVSRLSDGTVQVSEGVVKLNNGARELSDGVEEFDDKAVSKITDAYNDEVKDLAERIKAIVKAGEDYGTFSGAAKGMDATSKFIFRTDGVKADTEDE